MTAVSIVGYGRFGRVLHRLLKDDFHVTVYSRNPVYAKRTGFTRFVRDIYKNNIVFYAVPIDAFESVIKFHKQYFRPEHLLIDVLSVKMHSEHVFRKYLRGIKTRAILTHPMFGPDSSKENFDGLPIVMDRHTGTLEEFQEWKEFFTKKNLRVIEMSPKEHDKLAASSQGLTHFVGRMLGSYGVRSTPIDSLGSKKILEIIDQTCNDTWQLFSNLQQFNPYTKHMRVKLGDSFDLLYNKLLPKQKDKKFVTIGIQGGKGSFNEQAIGDYLQRQSIDNFKIRYLYTSHNVLKALHAGDIDLGQFAIHNSVGGVVTESIQAMAKYRFNIVEEFSIKISHALMIRPDAELSDITTIMTHPQVLAQCKESLRKIYPNLIQTSGTGILVDHAMVAKQMSEKRLSKHIATMGSMILAKIYDLIVIEDNLQDAKVNDTSFLIVSRM